MSRSDIKLVDGGGIAVPTRTVRVEAGATAILAGEPVKLAGNYAVPVADAEPTDSNPMLGIAQNDSSETGSIDGVVDVYVLQPGVTVLRARVTTPANIDTDAELLALLNNRVAFTLSGGVYTIDENLADAATNGLQIIDGDVVNGMLDVVLLATSSENN